jgi:multidrug efflux system membrane fusion protein
MRYLVLLVVALISKTAMADEVIRLEPEAITEWKAVYGQIETRDRVPARARIGGVVVELELTEGDRVVAGQRLATVEDDKLSFQRDAIDARLTAARARLATAETELDRGETLLERGVITNQRMDELRTAVDVISGEINTLESERLVIEQQVAEGQVLSPVDGVLLSVPISRGSVVTPGDAVAEVGGGGVFLRLSIPERHATDLSEGDVIELTAENGATGRLVKLYPLIEGGRVEADVEIEGLDARYVGRRVPVRLPVGEREALLLPQAAVERFGALDMVTVETFEGEMRRVVVPGQTVMREGEPWREILSGLAPGDRGVVPDE